MATEKAHAEFSASASERWIRCPGSHQRNLKWIRENGEPPESGYAAEGTEAHACLEAVLKWWPAKSVKRPKSFPAEVRQFPEEMLEHAVEFALWLHKQPDLGEAEIQTETKVDSSRFTCTGQFGTLDVAVLRPFGRLTIIDYKYGAGVAVEPVTEDGQANSQLAYYALATAYEHEDLCFTDCELVVYQPRAFHESGETVRSHVLSMDELYSWHDVFRSGVMETSDPKAPLRAGKWCRFCPSSITCPKVKDEALENARIAFTETTGELVLPDVTKVRPIPNLGRILEAADKLEEWIKGVRAHALHVLEKGGEVDGWKLVAKRGTRKWVDPNRAGDVARKRYGDDAFTTPVLLSPAQLEKAVGKRAPGLGEFLAKHVTSESTGTTLARADDKRPAVNPIENVFDAVGD